MDGSADSTNVVLMLIFMAAFGGFYFLPAISAVAHHTHTRRIVKVCLINLFLGWTVVGWLHALRMGNPSRVLRHAGHHHFA